MSFSYTHTPILSNLSFELRGDDRLWVYGPNGSGKSTLINIVMDRLKPRSGEIKIGENVTIGYFEQNQKHLPLDMTVEEYLYSQMHMTYGQTFSFLSGLSFTKDHRARKLGNLSPGERARLSLGVFTQKESNLLILDEPTNHLDIWTKEVVETALREFNGALVLVSHDRYFVEQVGVSKMLSLTTGNTHSL